jgi:hypothetical protein
MWDSSKRQAIVIGHTPSTATDDKDDQTTNKLSKMLQLFNYGGFTMLNLTDNLRDTQKSIINHCEFAGYLADDKSHVDDNLPAKITPDMNPKVMCEGKHGMELI